MQGLLLDRASEHRVCAGVYGEIKPEREAGRLPLSAARLPRRPKRILFKHRDPLSNKLAVHDDPERIRVPNHQSHLVKWHNVAPVRGRDPGGFARVPGAART